MRYYYTCKNELRDLIELTESEYTSLFGTTETAPYARQLYASEITADEIPEDIREKVIEVISNCIARFGAYSERSVSDYELAKLTKEVL